jgi:putative transposase
MISLGTEQTISKVAMIINGESSFGVNQQNIIDQIFGWKADSMALSVSELALEKVRKYIANQEEHLSAKKIAQEYGAFLNIRRLNKYLYAILSENLSAT